MNDNTRKYNEQKILKAACLAYNIDFEEAKLIRNNKNLIYDCGDKILRVSPSIIRTEKEIEAEIHWLIFLMGNKLPVVNIIPSKAAANWIKIVDSDEYFTIVCFKKIVGNKVSREYWNEKHFERLGKLTGQLHRVGNQYENSTGLNYQNWDSLLEFDSYKYLPQDKRELTQLHHKIVSKIKTLPKTKDNFGLIHYDIHHGNYLLTQQNKEMVLFDFEMTCRSWFMNDIATVLYYANHYPKTFIDEDFEVTFMKHFWKGYEREHDIKEFEKTWLPLFLLYRDLMVFGFISKIWKDKKLTKNELRYSEMIQASIKLRRAKLGH